uniref:Septin-9-like n=1 Tax=Gadus morhua TaxID=8049 RepID=A0A8C5CA78_GADMO
MRPFLCVSALKRSFEVEEADSSTHPSPLTRRTTNPLRSSNSSTSSQRSYDLGSRNSDYSSSRTSPSEPSNSRSPKTGIRRIDLSGGRNPDAAPSRRTEISIEVSSKQIDSSPSAGIARFGLKRPEVGLNSRSNHPESGSSGTDSQPSAAACSTRIPEPPQQKRPEPATPSPTEVSSRRPEAPVFRQQDLLLLENNSNDNQGGSHPPPVPSMAPEVMMPPVSGGIYSEKIAVGGGPVLDFSYVGIDAILEQMRKKAMKQGFELNIMVVGQSGLGKSTLMNTLFKSKVSRKSALEKEKEKIPKTVEIKSISHDVEEKGVRMKLTVIDTPGFGDQINNENCWQPIMKFINDQYEAYLQEEININRKKRIPDSRVHCCIYFIPPTGHCLRPLDVEFMRRLSKVVNIVPVIAKADTLTLEERDFFKQKIREELRANGIDVYPQKEFDEDAEDRMINEKIREMIPFAVVGSDQEYQVNGRRLLGRKTKWGTIEVENIAHCEFAYLRDLLIRTHMQNIKDITSSIHYELYRVRRLHENNTVAAANGLPEHRLVAHEM